MRASVAAIPDWWQTPNSATLPLLLPRLFFQHFGDTSTIVEDRDGRLAAFLVGFRSQSQPEVAYVHFVGVRPDLRGAGLARTLCARFFAQMQALGCRRVDAITGPVNLRSQAFHRAMGFALGGDTGLDGVPAYLDYRRAGRAPGHVHEGDLSGADSPEQRADAPAHARARIAAVSTPGGSAP